LVPRRDHQRRYIHSTEPEALSGQWRLDVNKHVVIAQIIMQSRTLPARTRSRERLVFAGRCQVKIRRKLSMG
jgi:hypothetical protein